MDNPNREDYDTTSGYRKTITPVKVTARDNDSLGELVHFLGDFPTLSNLSEVDSWVKRIQTKNNIHIIKVEILDPRLSDDDLLIVRTKPLLQELLEFTSKLQLSVSEEIELDNIININ